METKHFSSDSGESNTKRQVKMSSREKTPTKYSTVSKSFGKTPFTVNKNVHNNFDSSLYGGGAKFAPPPAVLLLLFKNGWRQTAETL